MCSYDLFPFDTNEARVRLYRSQFCERFWILTVDHACSIIGFPLPFGLDEELIGLSQRRQQQLKSKQTNMASSTSSSVMALSSDSQTLFADVDTFGKLTRYKCDGILVLTAYSYIFSYFIRQKFYT